MNNTEPLLQLLADGRFHSGEAIAAELGCSRGAVWKRVAKLRELPGLQIDSVTGRGYRLRDPLDLLDSKQILGKVSQEALNQLVECRVLGSVESTNALAMQMIPPPDRAQAWFAEHQSAGRGRRGRPWVSPYGRNLYFSLGWQFDAPLAEVAGLSIATGVMLAELLRDHGLRGHGLKWPNDVLWENRKLAGILVELQGETDGPAHVVVGIGINLEIDDSLQSSIDQPAVGLREAGIQPTRNELAARLLQSSIETCQSFTRQGLSAFVDRWEPFDLFAGKPVSLNGPGRQVTGVHLGLAPDGGIRLQVDGAERIFHAGELSLRAATT